MRFTRWLGVRHVQVLLLSFLLFLDIYHTELLKFFLNKNSQYMGKGGKFHRAVRGFRHEQTQFIEELVFLCFAIGRSLCPLVIMRVNNKYLLLSLVGVEVLCCGLFQYLVELYHYLSFAILAGIIFLAQAFHYPLAINSIAKWIPPNEYTRATVMLSVGETVARSFLNHISNVTHVPIMTIVFNAGIICKAVWGVAYLIIGAQDPQTSFLIRKNEWDLLSKEIGPRKKVQCSMKIPWKSILTCPRLYAMFFCEVANKWFYLSVTLFHVYCPDIDIGNADLVMIFHPFLGFGIAWLMDTMIAKYYVSRNNARKIMNTVSLWGGALSLAFMCYWYKEPSKVVIHLMVAQYLAYLVECSQTASVFDISPNYAAVIFCFYMTPAWGSIILRSQLNASYTKDSSLKKSLPIYYEAGFLMFVFNYAFLMIGNITLTKFDAYDTHDWRKESVISYP